MRKIKGFLLATLATLFAPAAVAGDNDEMVLNLGTANTPASSAAAEPPSSQTLASSLRISGVWLLLLGALSGAALYVARKRKAASCSAATAARLAVLERVALGAQRELLLVRACDRLLVLSACGNQLSLLSDLPTENSPSQPFPNLDSKPQDALPSGQIASIQGALPEIAEKLALEGTAVKPKRRRKRACDRLLVLAADGAQVPAATDPSQARLLAEHFSLPVLQPAQALSFGQVFGPEQPVLDSFTTSEQKLETTPEPTKRKPRSTKASAKKVGAQPWPEFVPVESLS